MIILLYFRPKREEILKHCRFLVRKLRYEEMTRQDPLKAMQYLRHHIADVIDHSDAEQLNNVCLKNYFNFCSFLISELIILVPQACVFTLQKP